MDAIFPNLRRRYAEIGFARLWRWATKGGWALLDQGLFSGANFLVNILLARWLPPKEYGAFAVALSVFYLLAGFHTAVLTEPMLVFGAGKYRERFRKYLGMLLWGHWAISALIALGLAGAGWFFLRRGSPLGEALLGLAVAAPFLLLLWLTRRACYVPMRPIWAAEGSTANLLIVLGGVLWLPQSGVLSALSGMMLLGTAAGIASLLLITLHLQPRIGESVDSPTPKLIFAEHKDYGGWSILAFVAYWSSSQIIMLLIPAFLGLDASAAVAATWNLYRPVSLFIQSTGLILLPIFSKWVNEGIPSPDLRKRTTQIAFLVASIAALYGIILTINAKAVLHLLYAGKYDNEWALVGLFGISTTASLITSILSSTLKAQGRIRIVSGIWGISAGVTVLLSIPLMYIAGVEGALLVFAFAYVVAASMSYQKITQ